MSKQTHWPEITVSDFFCLDFYTSTQNPIHPRHEPFIQSLMLSVVREKFEGTVKRAQKSLTTKSETRAVYRSHSSFIQNFTEFEKNRLLFRSFDIMEKPTKMTFSTMMTKTQICHENFSTLVNFAHADIHTCVRMIFFLLPILEKCTHACVSRTCVYTFTRIRLLVQIRLFLT